MAFQDGAFEVMPVQLQQKIYVSLNLQKNNIGCAPV